MPRFPYLFPLYLLLVITSTDAWAQAPFFQNIHPLEVPGNVFATVTANGYVYVAGIQTHWEEGRVDPESGPASIGNNAFVGKWDPATHRLVWLLKMSQRYDSKDYASTLVVQDSSVYVLGSFEKESEGFGYPIKTSGFSDLFVAKLTDHGNRGSAEWTQALGYAVSNEIEGVTPQAHHLACNGAALYVAGTIVTEFRTWNPATGNKAPNVTRAFVAKLTDAGTRATPSWQHTWTVNADNYRVVTLASQQGKLYLAANTWQYTPGREEPTSTLELGALPTHANYQLQLTQISDQGNRYHLDWTHKDAGQVSSVALSGNTFYVVGREDADQSFGRAIQPPNAQDVPGDLFVAKLVVAGSGVRPVWVQRLRGTGHDEDAGLHNVVVGQHVFVAGTFGTASLAIGSTILRPKPFSRINDSEADLFVAQLTDTGATGRFNWAQRLGGAHKDYLLNFSLAGSQLYIRGLFQGFHGQPIQLGEQQFLLPDDSQVPLQAWLPVAD